MLAGLVNCSAMAALLHRFHSPSRLLAHALLTGGVNGAQKVLNKLRGVHSLFSLRSFLETLCEDEAWLDKHTQELTTKPLVCLFSDAFKTDLLCFLHLVHSWAPQDSVLSLLHCLSQEVQHKPWIWALIRQLHRDIGDEGVGEKTLLTSECVVRLKGLCERFKAPQAKGGWEAYLNEHRSVLQADSGTDLVQKKRKSEVMDLDTETDMNEPQTKRVKTDSPDIENSEGEKETVDEEAGDEKALQLYSGPERASPPEEPHEDSLSVLPEHIKAAVPLMKELLESETEWDESCMPTLKVLNECDTKQLEILCGILGLAETPEQTLPHFCSFLLALTPDLSHSAASVIIKNLLLDKVLSLTEPASRSLVTGVTSLCSRYPRPTCQALIEPVIKEGQTGSAQAELLCRLVKDCLEPHHRLLVFEMTLEGAWNEGLLSVIHALLDLKIELNEGLFSLFTNQLSSQCPQFTKSMKFAKMILTVLTKFQCHVNAACQQTLSCCISFNETFLKKSLQAALKRITL
ncbi:Fanconi anemia group E protein [Salminus brasiliensis]|uniref:Fanconi anemia group E protein n=1 Tax=Salminus brasiliensis TaxID=930266 RepID=UPI003B830BB3